MYFRKKYKQIYCHRTLIFELTFGNFTTKHTLGNSHTKLVNSGTQMQVNSVSPESGMKGMHKPLFWQGFGSQGSETRVVKKNQK